MIVKDIVYETFQDYKKPSMLIATCMCDFKCLTEQNLDISICQNSELTSQKNIEIDDNKIIKRYLTNDVTQAIVIGGLEPFLQFDEIVQFIDLLRYVYNNEDDIVIFTGYYLNEIEYYIKILSYYKNIIIKFGRYIPNTESVYDNILGIVLSSNNQYAVKL